MSKKTETEQTENLPAILTPAFELVSTIGSVGKLDPRIAADLDASDLEGYSATIPRPAKVTIRNATVQEAGKTIIEMGGFKFYSKAFDGTKDADGQEGLFVTFLMETSSRSFFPEGHEGAPPCRSWDGINGQGDPGGVCRLCPLAQWPDKDSKEKKKKKSPPCREEINLLAYDHSMKMVYYFQIWRAGIAPYLEFCEVCGITPLHAIRAHITTKFIDAKPTPYFVPVFRIDEQLPFEQYQEMKALRAIAKETFVGGVKADTEDETLDTDKEVRNPDIPDGDPPPDRPNKDDDDLPF